MSSEEARRQGPRILKGPTVSADIFVLPVHQLGGAVHAEGTGEARPFVPPRLGEGEVFETGLLPDGWGDGIDFAEPEPEAAPPPPPDPTPEILAAAEARAAEIVAAAEMQAQQLLQAAHQEVAATLDAVRGEIAQAQQAAYAEGYRVSMAAAREDLGTQLQQAAGLLEGAQTAKAQALADAEPEVIRLVLAIAKRVIHREIAADPRIVVETVRESLRRLGGRAVARVRVHASELAALNDAWNELTSVARDIEFVADESVSPGGCIVESRQGEIDAQVETQVAAVAAQFLDTADRDVADEAQAGDPAAAVEA